MRVETAKALDLTTLDPTGPDMATPAWENRQSYAACQDIADTARGAGAEIIRYRSVRDPAGGANLAVLRCETFRTSAPDTHQTWRIRLSQNGAQAVCDFPRRAVEFQRSDFAADPRMG